MCYQVPVEISRQADNLWRVEPPALQGCWVDEPTLAEALYEIHEVIAMFFHLNQEEDHPPPEEVRVSEALPLYASIPVSPDEIEFYNVVPTGERLPASAAAKERMAR